MKEWIIVFILLIYPLWLLWNWVMCVFEARLDHEVFENKMRGKK
jgi:hypothetical protein